MSDASAAAGPKLLDRVRQAMRTRHLSRRTEGAYVGWIRRYVVFHGKQHPSTMGAPQVAKFLSWLATQRKVSASTQNQALCAILFLYKDVLKVDLARSSASFEQSSPSVCRWCSVVWRCTRFSLVWTA